MNALILFLTAASLFAATPSDSQEPGQLEATGVVKDIPEAVLRTLRLAREDEDWRWLAAGSSSPEALDSLKYRPIFGGRASLTLGGQLRVRFESIEDEAWGLASDRRQDIFLARARFHADLRSERFRIFAELQAADLDGRESGPRPSIDRDRLDAQQVFLEIPLGIHSRLRLGRQELSFGLGRMISLRAGEVNVRQPQDGVRWIFEKNRWRLDAFAVRIVDTRPDVFDDSSRDGADLFGVYWTFGQPYRSPQGLELYLFRHDRPFAAYSAGAGPEQRATAGFRTWFTLRGWQHDFEVAYQFGDAEISAQSTTDAEVDAWAVASQSSYRFDVAWRPTFELTFGFNSGDGDPVDGAVQTFVAPLPRGSYFGSFAPFGPGNMQGARAGLILEPTAGLKLIAGVYGFWRHQLEDGLYGLSGFPLLGPGGEERHMGVQFELGASVKLGQQHTFGLDLALFDVSNGLRQLGADEDIFSFGVSYQFTF